MKSNQFQETERDKTAFVSVADDTFQELLRNNRDVAVVMISLSPSSVGFFFEALPVQKTSHLAGLHSFI